MIPGLNEMPKDIQPHIKTEHICLENIETKILKIVAAVFQHDRHVLNPYKTISELGTSFLGNVYCSHFHIDSFATMDMWSEGKIIFGKSPFPRSFADGTSRTALLHSVFGSKKMKSMVSFFSEHKLASLEATLV